MIFLTNIQRIHHPQASIIPKKIWNHYFGNQLTKCEIDLMKSRPKFIHLSAMKWRINVVYLCFLYAHPKTTAEEFLHFVGKERYKLNHAFVAACSTNRIDIIWLFKKNYPKEFKLILEERDFAVVMKAIRFCSLPMIKLLMSSYTGYPINLLRANRYGVFRCCCWRTSLRESLFNYLLSIQPQCTNEFLLNNQFSIFNLALKKGNSALVQRIIDLFPHLIEYMMLSQGYQSFMNATESGRIHTLKYLFSFNYCTKMDVIRFNNYQIVKVASQNGRLELLKYLIEEFNSKEKVEIISSSNYEAIYLAASYGHIKTLNFLLQLISNKEHAFSKNHFCKVFICSAEKGRISMLQRLMHLKPEWGTLMNASDDFAAFRKAAQRGKINVLQFLAKAFPEKIHQMVSADSFFSFRRAVFLGKIEVIRYLFHLYPKAIGWMIAAKNFEAFENASVNGNVPLFKFLLSKAPNQVLDLLIAQESSVFLKAVSWSHLELVKYLVKLNGGNLNSLVLVPSKEIIDSISDIRILKYLCSLNLEYKQRLIFGNECSLFIRAAAHSKTDILEFIMQSTTNQLAKMIQAQKFRALRSIAAMNEDSEVMRLLISVREDLIVNMLCSELFAVVAASAKGAVLFEYFISLAPDKFQGFVRENRFRIIRAAVRHGNITILQLIYVYAPHELEEAIDLDEELIRLAVQGENLEVLECLLSLSLYPEHKSIFMISENAISNECALNKESLLLFSSRSLFVNPLQLSIEIKLNLLLSCITLGYLSIAQALAYQFFGNKYFHYRLLISKVLAKNPQIPGQLEMVLDFLKKRMHISEHQLQSYLIGHLQDSNNLEVHCIPIRIAKH